MSTAPKLELVALPSLLDRVDLHRLEATKHLDRGRRSALGQFMTPPGVASFMASLFEKVSATTTVLDAGAGVGSLLAAFVAEACTRHPTPGRIHATAFELDPDLASHLRSTVRECRDECARHDIRFSGDIIEADFIQTAVEQMDGGLFGPRHSLSFTHAILNPPYKKLNSDSAARVALRRVGIETSNLYTAFLGLAILLLEPGGELVAITPRSFCNGPYFRPFREMFLKHMALRRVHVFESRTAAFADDEVLQENVIFHAIKGMRSRKVVISSSSGPEDELYSVRSVKVEDVVRPADPQRFIHVVPDDSGERVAFAVAGLPCGLGELDLAVSTGKVVDFRAKEYLRSDPDKTTGPLIYPTHFAQGVVRWPKPGKKPNALVDERATKDLWMPSGTYVLVKRFSSKEERRRVVAVVFDPELVPGEKVGFENHLNVFHRNGGGLAPDVARGLAAFLNSTLVDTYFRQFNGHTQVNATDLRNLRYPSKKTLEELGRSINDPGLPQHELDFVVQDVLGLADGDVQVAGDRLKRTEEALAILRALGLPKQQQNERSALTLLALLDVKPDTLWSQAAAPLMGITPIMEFIAANYGKEYAPNTRETVRRQTVHQFLDAGLIVANPDQPGRPVNSPKAVYQIEAKALDLLRTYGAYEWPEHLANYLGEVGSLAERYLQIREMTRIPVKLPKGQTLTLSPGGQNDLVKEIIEKFCPRFVPGGHVIYVGDTEDKFALFDERGLQGLGVTIDSHGKMPDVVVHRTDKDWLVLIEAVTSHGPVDPKRRGELSKLFKSAEPGLVFVTAFMTRKAMVKYLADISWETEVWVAESPDHMIHFNGERFLGPYEKR